MRERREGGREEGRKGGREEGREGGEREGKRKGKTHGEKDGMSERRTDVVTQEREGERQRKVEHEVAAAGEVQTQNCSYYTCTYCTHTNFTLVLLACDVHVYVHTWCTVCTCTLPQ